MRDWIPFQHAGVCGLGLGGNGEMGFGLSGSDKPNIICAVSVSQSLAEAGWSLGESGNVAGLNVRVAGKGTLG